MDPNTYKIVQQIVADVTGVLVVAIIAWVFCKTESG